MPNGRGPSATSKSKFDPSSADHWKERPWDDDCRSAVPRDPALVTLIRAYYLTEWTGDKATGRDMDRAWWAVRARIEREYGQRNDWPQLTVDAVYAYLSSVRPKDPPQNTNEWVSVSWGPTIPATITVRRGSTAIRKAVNAIRRLDLGSGVDVPSIAIEVKDDEQHVRSLLSKHQDDIFLRLGNGRWNVRNTVILADQ